MTSQPLLSPELDEIEATLFLVHRYAGRDTADTLRATIRQLREQVRESKVALEPFVEALEIHEDVGRSWEDDDRINIVQSHGILLAELDEETFERARTVHSKLGE